MNSSQAYERGCIWGDESYRLTLPDAKEPILILEKGGVVACSNAAARMINASISDIIAKHPAVFSPDRQGDGRVSLEKCLEMDRLASEKGVHRFHWMHRSTDGELISVEVTSSSLFLNNRHAYLIHWTPASQEQAVRSELRVELDQARRESRIKSDVLSSATHEIKNPLGAMLGMLELLNETKLDPEQKQLLQAMRFSANSMDAAVRGYLDMNLIESGVFRLQSQRVCMVELLEEVRSIFQYAATQKGLTLSVEIDPYALTIIKGDETRLRQVLINLMSNAVKATSRGKVALCVRRCYNAKEGIVIEVKDTGVGIPPEHLPNVFKPFQDDISGHGVQRGAGLGLSIVKNLVDLMNGSISVSSVVGEGTTFQIEL